MTKRSKAGPPLQFAIYLVTIDNIGFHENSGISNRDGLLKCKRNIYKSYASRIYSTMRDSLYNYLRSFADQGEL